MGDRKTVAAILLMCLVTLAVPAVGQQAPGNQSQDTTLGQVLEQAQDEPAEGTGQNTPEQEPSRQDESGLGDWFTERTLDFKLMWNRHIEATDVAVHIRGDTAVVVGTVSSRENRNRVLEVVRNTQGIARVEDRLQIRQEPPGPVTRALSRWMTGFSVKAQLLWNRRVGGMGISVDVRDGTVVLDGDVASEQARQEALSIARNTQGVRSVEDRLRATGTNSANGNSGGQ